MIAPSFESHQCLAGMWKTQLSCHAGCQEVGMCCTIGESQGTCNITCTPLLSSNKAEPTLASKPRGYITRSPKQGYHCPHKKDSCPPKNFKKNKVLRFIWKKSTPKVFQNLLIFKLFKSHGSFAKKGIFVISSYVASYKVNNPD